MPDAQSQAADLMVSALGERSALAVIVTCVSSSGKPAGSVGVVNHELT